ncbi:SAM-dependent methyltransferase [Mycolicibacter sinensis]|uniref:SAM-dependent methyltransferase n=1 Tax=Mycolicibacter sinensis (strain JDM601) TaxID=875328 RepID=UPI0007E97597|nr:SAM-dependent methyltransferase [Mycolicibacter sinensis]OBH20201.1 methyltransferase [Mycolicibacter sinensis]
MYRTRGAVANTGILVAAIRAQESARADALFSDPFAAKLAGEAGRAMLAGAVAAAGDQSTWQIVVRTRFWDEALLRSGIRQVVILAAGMDARAYRLSWPERTTVFEVDQPAVMAAKADLLAEDQPRCRRVPIGIDLADDWPNALQAAGFDATAPSVWLIEGLLQYLDDDAVHLLFDRVDALSAPGSALLYDVVGKTLLEAPSMAPLLQSMARQGSPWLFGSDTPGELAERLGWSAVVTDVSEPAIRWDRWQAPAAESDGSDAPRGYFVEAALAPARRPANTQSAIDSPLT